jgi:hypothetical protein
MSDAFTWGSGGNKLTAADRNRRMAEALIAKGTDTSPVQHWAQGLNRVAQALLGGMYMNDADRSDKAGAAGVAADAALLMGGGGASPAVASAPAGAAPSMAGGGGARTMAMPNVSPEIKDGIVQTASALGISPVDLATTISYETGGTFDPTKAGPTTKWGQHRGLIQFGEPQAKQHGVDWSNPVASQLGANGAVASLSQNRRRAARDGLARYLFRDQCGCSGTLQSLGCGCWRRPRHGARQGRTADGRTPRKGSAAVR